MLNDLETIDSYLNSFVSKSVDNPLRLAVSRLRNYIHAYHQDESVKKPGFLEKINDLNDLLEEIANSFNFNDILPIVDKINVSIVISKDFIHTHVKVKVPEKK